MREVSQLEVRDREADNRSLVELGSDSRRKGQQLGQLVKFEVLFAPSRPRRVSAFLLTHLQDAEMSQKRS